MSISINVTPAASGGIFTVGSVSSQNLTLQVTGGIGPPGLGNLMLAEGDGIDIATVGNVATISANLTIPANLADLTDVSAAAPSAGQVLEWNGTQWAPGADTTLSLASAAPSNLGTAAAGTGTAAARDDHVHAMPGLGDLTDVTLSSPASGEVLTWNGSAWTAAADSTDLTGYATESFVNSAVANLVDSSPAALDTLNELAAALGDDPNFSSTITASLAGKAAANHTHSIADVTGLQAELDAKAAASGLATVATTGSYSDLAGIPTEFTPAAHSHTSADITDFATAASENAPVQSVNNATGDITIVNGTGLALTANSSTLTLALASGAGGGITWASEPAASNSTGNAGQIAYGSGFFYLHDGTNWRRAALATFGSETPTITITTQPENLTLADGGSGNLAVAATVSDGSTPSYQWQNSDDSGATWDTLTGSTGTTYTLANVSAADNGTQYRAIVSATGAADVASDVATLTVGAVAETFDLLTEASDRLITETGDSLDHDSVTGTLTAYGSPIQADASGDQMGTAVAISDDGNRVIVAAGYNDAAGVVAGQVKVLEYAGGAWSVLATEYGDAAGDNCGDGVDMSADGSVVAVTFSQSSSSGTGYCRVFAEVGGSWVQRGSDFTNASIIALDDAGDTAAVASRGGGLWVYDWSGTDWVLRGGTQSTQVGGITHINGGLSLSGDGSLVATSSMTYNSGAGGATVQRWTGTNWVSHGGQVLSSSDSTNGGTQYFGKSVDISSDGTVLVVGEITSSSSSTGKVKAYSWNGTTWVQRGSTLTDAVTNDQKGFSVSVNGDGTVLVATSRIPRTVSVYQWDGSDWQLADTDTGYGEQVAINSAGTRIAAGHTDAGVDAVQTFTYE